MTNQRSADEATVAYGYPHDQRSALYRVRINGQEAPVSEIPGIAPEEYEGIAAAYRQMPPYCWVDARFVALHYCHVACAGPAEVEVTVSRPVREYVIHPKRRKICGALQGDTLRFTVGAFEPRYLMVNFVDLPLLCLFIDPPEKDVPARDEAGVIDLADYLAQSADATDAFHWAIREVNGTGRTLFVPAGEYDVGTIHIQNAARCRIYFQPGAILRTRISPPGANEHRHGLWLENCRDITIHGRGCVDQQGYEQFAGGRNDYKHGMIGWEVPSALNPYTTQSPLFITHSQNIVVEGLVVRNGRNFNVNVRRCDSVTLRGCKVLTPPASVPEFTDGYQINACHDTLLENCFAFCNDDCIACGHYFYSHDDREQTNTVARGFLGWNARANGVRIGFYSHYDLGDFTFENCDFVGADDSAAIIHPLRDSREARRYQRYGVIRFQDCGFDLCNRMVTGLLQVDRARIERLEFVRVAFDGPAPAPSVIRGHPEDKIGKLVFKGVTIGGAPVTDLASAGIAVQDVKSIEISE
jgi:hypothetical protein